MRPWFRQTRVRLALAYSGIFGLVLLVAAGALLLTIDSVELKAIDDSLSSAAQALQPALVAGDGQTLPGSVASHTQALPGEAVIGVAALLFDDHGNALDSVGQGPSVTAAGPIARRAAAGGSLVESDTLDGIPQRVHATVVHVRSGEARVLVVTRSQAEADQLVRTTASVLLLGTLVLVTAATVLGYGLAQTALRPVREIAAAARTFSDQDLHRRISLDLPADELGELAATFNAMLERLETAFESLRRFTADAAHELRAPLTLIRTEAEVALSRPRSEEQYRASLGTVLAEAERLSRLADQLLMLARAEAGALTPQMTAVDIASLVRETVQVWLPVAADRQVELTATGPKAAVVRGDRDLLRRLLDNLIDNALRHSPAGTSVTVAVASADRGWRVTVADQGPGVADAMRPSIFDRFSRGDQSRARQTGGAGLGLALCAAIAQIHQGSLVLETGPPPGARFTLRLPAPAS